MRFIHVVIFLLGCCWADAQNLSGHWEGELYQNPGKTFLFHMDIEYIKVDSVKGITTIVDPNSSNYGKISFVGAYKDSVLSFKELLILKEDKSNSNGYWKSLTFFWCIKSGDLKFSTSNGIGSLEGNWKSTGGCQPGTLAVRKKMSKTLNCAESNSASFLKGVWSGQFKQYSCGVNDIFEMLLIVNETRGMEFSGFIIWPNSKLYRDSRSKFNGIIKDDQIYIYETEQISGDPLLVGGTYHSNLENCKKLTGIWNMPEIPTDCNTPEVTKNGGQYSLDQYNIPTIYFPHRKSDLSPRSKKELDELIRFMSAFKSVKINLSGHTDNTGSNAFNLLLSAERAQVVKEYLIEKGVEENRISTAHNGSMKPAEGNSTESGRILNRRTEITICRE